MKSFIQFLENKDNSFIENKALSAIKTGKNIQEDFWEQFLLLLNNSDGLSELLDVPETKIITWRDKIQKAIKHVEQANDHDKTSKKNKIMHTGFNK